jgi:TRAP-type C4-dicarboxylate transport system permease small subunit
MASSQGLLEKCILAFEKATQVVMFGLMVLVTADTIRRYAFNSPIHGVFEMTEFMMAALVFLTLAYAQRKKAMINVNLLTSHFSPRTNDYLNLFVYIFGFIFWALITWQGAEAVYFAWKIMDRTPGLVKFPLYPPKSLVPIGGALLCIQLIIDIRDTWKKL